jgi:hypothetical protein
MIRMARRNRRVSDTQYVARRVRQMRRTEVSAVRYLAADLRPASLLAADGAR